MKQQNYNVIYSDLPPRDKTCIWICPEGGEETIKYHNGKSWVPFASSSMTKSDVQKLIDESIGSVLDTEV